ncbi:MAG TPA: glycosyltransferase [Acidimicrobiales bacterium]|nr:glycosyltransferase [Acidimicrobiales bacterium]
MNIEGPQVSGSPELTMVMPFYNPGLALGANVADVVGVLGSTGVSFEVLVVNDGSTDDSAATVEPTADGRVRLVELPAHAGKGEAVRVGLLQGRGRYRGFIDADGDIPADELVAFVDAIRRDGVDMVVGSKLHPASDVAPGLLRHVYSWGFQLLVRVLFKLRVRDTQTGIKVFRREVLDAVLALTCEQRYAFDLELLVLAVSKGFDRIEELPVRILRRQGSTVTVKAVGLILADIFAIWWRLRVRGSYRPEA